MRLINTKAHGIYDYLMGLLLISAPTIFNYSGGGLSQNISSAVGISLWLTGILTNYEFGLLKQISIKKHLFVDLLLGFILAISPWLCGFSEIVYKPHLVFGLSIIGVSFFTDRVLSHDLSLMLSEKKKQKVRNKRQESSTTAISSFPPVKFIIDPSEFLAYKALDKNGVLKKHDPLDPPPLG